MSNWKIVSRENLDVKAWDLCVSESKNEHIYGYSWYLDTVAPKWVAFVYSEYLQVFPLPVKKKLTISYVFQPEFHQRSSIFFRSNLQDESGLVDIISENISKIDLTCDINLFNSDKVLKNVILRYSNQESVINKNSQRNIKKAVKAGLKYCTASLNEVELAYQIFKKNTKYRLDENYKNNLLRLCSQLDKENALVVRKIENEDVVLGYVILAKSKKRIVLLQLAISEDGKKTGASHYLVSKAINEFSSEAELFDFEGSQNSGIARFYLSFGGEIEKYYHFHRNLSRGFIERLTS